MATTTDTTPALDTPLVTILATTHLSHMPSLLMEDTNKSEEKVTQRKREENHRRRTRRPTRDAKKVRTTQIRLED